MAYDEAGEQGRADADGRADAAEVDGRVRSMARATARSARRAGAATGKAAGFTYRQARRATHAEGAGDSGLFRLIELHAVNAAGDAAVAISLAGTLFFQVPTGEARPQVAQFLALTMLPFAIVAPLVGPFLDRFTHGRRWAIGGTMALRAFLCWVLADAVMRGSMALFPAALGVLVASKAYGVTRASAVPRLLPQQLTLVRANSRISLAGVVGAAVSAPLAVLASTFGAQWSLRYAFAAFGVATILAILLPARVDSSAGEERFSLRSRRRPPARVPHAVVVALRCNAGLRLLSGFLVMFMAFLLRDAPFPGWEERPELLLGLVVGAAGAGNTVGVALGSLLRTVKPELTVVLALLGGAAMTAAGAVLYSLVIAVLLGLTAGLAQSLGKLSLDALIQREIPDRTRTSAFARSETLLQLSWVVGGFIGIGMPLNPHLGLGVTAAILAAWSSYVLATARARRPAP
jgi:MFS family permease